MSTTEPSLTAKAKLLENPSRTVGSPTSTLSTNTCITPLQPSPPGAFMLSVQVPQVPTGLGNSKSMTALTTWTTPL